MTRLLALCGLFLCACASKSDVTAVSRHAAVEVLPPTFLVSDLPDDETRRLSGLLQRSLGRSVLARGYEEAAPAGGAPLQLRSSWVRDPGEAAARGETALAISFSVFAADGRRLLTARSVRGLPSRAWTEDRVNSEVGHLMRTFPERRP